jgi:hypothetical protein
LSNAPGADYANVSALYQGQPGALPDLVSTLKKLAASIVTACREPLGGSRESDSTLEGRETAAPPKPAPTRPAKAATRMETSNAQ